MIPNVLKIGLKSSTYFTHSKCFLSFKIFINLRHATWRSSCRWGDNKATEIYSFLDFGQGKADWQRAELQNVTDFTDISVYKKWQTGGKTKLISVFSVWKRVGIGQLCRWATSRVSCDGGDMRTELLCSSLKWETAGKEQMTIDKWQKNDALIVFLMASLHRWSCYVFKSGSVSNFLWTIAKTMYSDQHKNVFYIWVQ